MIITLDGPAASGKSTLARHLARAHGWNYLYSGMLYRGLAFALIHRYQYTPHDTGLISDETIHEIVRTMAYTYDPETGAITIDVCGEHYSSTQLKSPEIDDMSSRISANCVVRESLIHLQRAYATPHTTTICDGRDGGSVIFPHAEIKFFVTASPEVRAQRMLADQLKAGSHSAYAAVLAELQQRDTRDTQRACSPLVCPPDAIVIDTSTMTLEGAYNAISERIQRTLSTK